MRLVLTTALVLASSAAFASSITTIGGQNSSNVSIVNKSCETCKAAPQQVAKPTYMVPELAAGTQKVQFVDINGEKKIVRTEAWFGGSPVIHVSKAPAWMTDEKVLADIHPTTNGSTQVAIEAVEATSDGVDLDAKTSAVAVEQPVVVQAETAIRPLTLDTFQLRTN
jgi:hypothetical protein